jgi:hypothetical protein
MMNTQREFGGRFMRIMDIQATMTLVWNQWGKKIRVMMRMAMAMAMCGFMRG